MFNNIFYHLTTTSYKNGFYGLKIIAAVIQDSPRDCKQELKSGIIISTIICIKFSKIICSIHYLYDADLAADVIWYPNESSFCAGMTCRISEIKIGVQKKKEGSRVSNLSSEWTVVFIF